MSPNLTIRLKELVAVNIRTRLNLLISFFSSYYKEETKDIFLRLRLEICILKSNGLLAGSIIQFNLIFKHGKIWAKRKRYERRKERNTAT